MDMALLTTAVINFMFTNIDFCEVMNEGVKELHKPMVIVGPGTGVGAAFIYYNQFEGGYDVEPGEAGHQEFVVTNDQELRLRKFAIKYIKEKQNEDLTRLSVLRIIAGPGIPLVYEFFCQEYPDLPVAVEVREGETERHPGDIVDKAIKDNDELCMKTIGNLHLLTFRSNC
jgi:glucokinase